MVMLKKSILVQLQQVIVKEYLLKVSIYNYLTEPNYDKEHIKAERNEVGSPLRILDPNGYWNSTLRWPKYIDSIQNANNNNTNVTHFAPKSDKSREVKYTYGYKTGGDFSINRGGLTGNITKESNY